MIAALKEVLQVQRLPTNLWLFIAADAAADGGDDDEDECWTNVIPVEAPSLLASCRRLSQSCNQLVVNNGLIFLVLLVTNRHTQTTSRNL